MKAPSFFITTPNSLLLQWGTGISETTEKEILQAAKTIQFHFSEAIVEMIPSYNELAIYLKPTILAADVASKIKEVVLKSNTKDDTVMRQIVTVPVCYDESFALDIRAVADYHNMTTSKVIELHSTPVYRVSFLGFLPGFPYLSGLIDQLHTPRKATPRHRLEAGSVGIGGKQTGIYPQDSPGGWNIIGKSPIKLFDIFKNTPSLLQAGDLVKFSPVSLPKFQLIDLEVKSGVYSLEKSAHD